MAEDIRGNSCPTCHRPILGCSCGEPEETPYTSPTDNGQKNDQFIPNFIRRSG